MVFQNSGKYRPQRSEKLDPATSAPDIINRYLNYFNDLMLYVNLFYYHYVKIAF